MAINQKGNIIETEKENVRLIFLCATPAGIIITSPALTSISFPFFPPKCKIADPSKYLILHEYCYDSEDNCIRRYPKSFSNY